MSTSLSQPHLASSWKQEVNQRLAAHKSRKGAGGAEPEAEAAIRPSVSQRATEAVARVAARYANAPSYDEMLAVEARAALRAAEAVSKAALEAEAAAATVLAGIEATAAPQPNWEPFVSAGASQKQTSPGQKPAGASHDATKHDAARHDALHEPAGRAASEAVGGGLPPSGQSGTGDGAPSAPSLTVVWPPDLPELPAGPALAPAAEAPRIFEAGVEDGWEPASLHGDERSGEEIAIVEPSQPIRGNLIEFPRELVAARKVRPRRAEGTHAELQAGTQLSIFEVDPEAISTQPEAAAGALEEAPLPVWTAPQWSGIELEAQPQGEAGEALEEPAIESASSPVIEPAPVSRRLLAAVVDATLISAAVVAAAVVAADHVRALPGLTMPGLASPGLASPLASASLALPGLHHAVVCVGLALLVTALLYQVLFFTLGRATPGMKYAQISLCTFDGHSPTRAQMRRRLAALLLSVLPVGLGFGWLLFDDDRLTWHDRLSKTYPHRY